MKKSDQYLKIVEWSEEDQCYVGTCPGLMRGGIHGNLHKTLAIDAMYRGKSLNEHCGHLLREAQSPYKAGTK